LTIALIAHRGGTDRYPELTIDAARNSLKLGADYIEFDIRFTKDNVPIISHDKDALKLFGNTSNIRELSLEQFKNLCYVSDNRYHPHTLEEVLSSGIAPIVFHIKEGGNFLLQILEYIRNYGYDNKVVLGVTTTKDIQEIKAFGLESKVLGFVPTKEHVIEFIESGADIIRLWEDWVDKEIVFQIHKECRQVWVMAGSISKGTIGYTNPETILEWKQLGVDGILVDEIEKTKYLL